MIGDDIEVKVLAVLGDKVKLGIRAPRHIPVYRDEIYLELAQQDRTRAGSLRADIDEALRRLGDKP
jgi:carbon storage regulator